MKTVCNAACLFATLWIIGCSGGGRSAPAASAPPSADDQESPAQTAFCASPRSLSASSQQPDPASASLCQGNGIYTICIDASSRIGRYTVQTGVAHPDPGRSLLYGKAFDGTQTSGNSYRSFSSGNVYGLGGQAASESAVSRNGPDGLRTELLFDGADRLSVEETLRVSGTTLRDSRVEIATTLVNAGKQAVDLGIRYLWDIEGDGGITFVQAAAAVAPIRHDQLIVDPTFDWFRFGAGDDPQTPALAGSIRLQGPLEPTDFAPSLLGHVCLSAVLASNFDYFSDGAVCERDSAVVYWWGHDRSRAFTLGPGESVTVSGVLFNSPTGAS